jgi:hypothetical protein
LYFKDIFNELPHPLSDEPSNSNVTAPDGYVDLITDNENNYVDYVLPDPIPVCAGTPTDKPSATQTYVESKISAYCTQVVSTNWIVNSTLGLYGPIGYKAGDSAPASDNDLWLSVSFDRLCQPSVSYAVQQDDCEKYFGIALNGCNTDTTTAKWGGQVEANCVLWNITTRSGHNMIPPNGLPQVSSPSKRNVAPLDIASLLQMGLSYIS